MGLPRARHLAFGVVVVVVHGLIYWRFIRARVAVWRDGGKQPE